MVGETRVWVQREENRSMDWRWGKSMTAWKTRREHWQKKETIEGKNQNNRISVSCLEDILIEQTQRRWRGTSHLLAWGKTKRKKRDLHKDGTKAETKNLGRTAYRLVFHARTGLWTSFHLNPENSLAYLRPAVEVFYVGYSLAGGVLVPDNNQSSFRAEFLCLSPVCLMSSVRKGSVG